MRVLVVGSGGREHAICWKLSQSSKISKLFCVPGNGGIGALATCLPIASEDIDGICKLAKDEKIDLAVIGPEVPLAMGIVDKLEAIGIKAFGPNKKCARLEASKAFTKDFLYRHNIPTAKYREYTDIKRLKADTGIFGYPMILKADGLAAGKGVVIAQNQEEALAAMDLFMTSKVFGEAGSKVIVEECLVGVEASILCFVDGHTIMPMESAQDYKRIFDGDKGPNTGGMGTYSPSLVLDVAMNERIRKEILAPTLAGFQKDDLDFRGVLFVGIMITKEGPKVIEFNNRFGDPETQSVLPRMKTDLLDVFLAVCENRLGEVSIEWGEEKAICVILAAGGYPGNYLRGVEIFGLDKEGQLPVSKTKEDGSTKIYDEQDEQSENVLVFHSGTMIEHMCQDDRCYDAIATNGGRVLGVVALGQTHEEARKLVYKQIERIEFEGMQYRRDIGLMNTPCQLKTL